MEIIITQSELVLKKTFDFDSIEDNQWLSVPLDEFKPGEAQFEILGVDGVYGRSVTFWMASDRVYQSFKDGKPFNLDANFRIVYRDNIEKLVLKSFKSHYAIFFLVLAYVVQLSFFWLGSFDAGDRVSS